MTPFGCLTARGTCRRWDGIRPPSSWKRTFRARPSSISTVSAIRTRHCPTCCRRRGSSGVASRRWASAMTRTSWPMTRWVFIASLGSGGCSACSGMSASRSSPADCRAGGRRATRLRAGSPRSRRDRSRRGPLTTHWFARSSRSARPWVRTVRRLWTHALPRASRARIRGRGRTFRAVTFPAAATSPSMPSSTMTTPR